MNTQTHEHTRTHSQKSIQKHTPLDKQPDNSIDIPTQKLHTQHSHTHTRTHTLTTPSVRTQSSDSHTHTHTHMHTHTLTYTVLALGNKHSGSERAKNNTSPFTQCLVRTRWGGGNFS